jgi:hypothetical protein
MSSDPTLTPDAAREALASVGRMQAKGHTRGVWPRWAKAIEAVFTGVLLGLIAANQIFITAAVALPMLAFRFWCAARFGTVLKFYWTDIGYVVLITGSMPLAFWLRRADIAWAPVALGMAFAAIYFILYEVRRRARPASPESM